MSEGQRLTGKAPQQDVPPRAVIPVAGIGASAGSPEVFKHLLADLPADAGLAIVLVQHLDPKRHSVAEMLAQSTAMPVREAADGMPLEANHVYVIPADAHPTVAHGALRLAPLTPTPGPCMPIDRFLRSLADECGSGAMGVILSGTGSDGSAGLAAVKAAGGVTFAQDRATAEFATMPQAAAATGCVDFVLPPKRIAAELVRIGRHHYMAGGASAVEEQTPAAEEERFGAILSLLRGATGIDFSLYREEMVRRRILRRLALRNIDGLAEYSQRLEHDPDELAALERDLLIAATSFFRDPESFESLKQLVFPRIVQRRPENAPIRVWVAGCGTGEEAFSIAISLQEYLDEAGAAWPVRIFASDISLPAIEKARSGRYPGNIAAYLTQERLNRYFTKVEGGYQVNQNLREMCIFARHNLIGDPPLSKLDLISCRNVLIYLGSAQENIIPLFHYALKPTGFLMLGASEAAGPGGLFSVVDREHRIYARRDAARKPHQFHAGAGGSPRDACAPGPARRREAPEPLSVNEELQKFNRELEAAKEELQSTKEELIAVNVELEARSRVLTQAVDDITARRLAQNALRRKEEHLRQSQKMEAVGMLAGGIAHDFNNLLTAIIGYSDLLQYTLAGNLPAVQQVLEIKNAGERAASLTQQLLFFSRRQVLQPKVLDLNVIVGDFERMLRRLVGERIEVAVACAPGLWQVRADAGEIGRAIMNLSLNARDAMPEGGTLAIETANATLSDTDASGPDLVPGRYAVLAVRDTGAGMDAELKAHLFEPFFTTKEPGKGTGLGLAAVLGIVEQSGGAIRCHSEPGRGTTFRIFLPAVAAPDQRGEPAGGPAEAPKGSEVILLVEDEDAVRKLARMALETSGYMVLDARNGREGLALCQAHKGPIDLLVTDVVMPELGGRELAQGALKLRPGMRVLFVSGHAPDVVLREGVRKGTAFLRKPFSPFELTQKVRQTLDM